MALLVDLGGVPSCLCDSHLDDLYKALAEHQGGEAAMWAPHDNDWIRDHVEDVTRRFQRILEAIQDAFARLLTGEPIDMLAKAEWARWTQGQFDEARARLESKPANQYTLDDWLLVVDYIIQRYLPDGVIQSEAEYLTVRAAFAGKIAANMARGPSNAPTPSQLVAFVPTDFAHVPPKVLTPLEFRILQVAKARAAENISDVAESARHRMKTIIIEHVQASVLGQKEGDTQYLRQRIFDEFGQLNRDFRRIAVTEVGEVTNTAFVANARGRVVQRQEAYRGACDFCRSINGRRFKVVDASAPVKDGANEVWVGKTNIGRSASPRKREGGALVERPASERWWPAAGVQHPHCRGSWVMVSDRPPKVSPEFADWLDAQIAEALKRPAPS